MADYLDRCDKGDKPPDRSQKMLVVVETVELEAQNMCGGKDDQGTTQGNV